MVFEKNDSARFQSHRCMVCDTVIVVNPLKPDQPKLCGNVQCQALYKQSENMPPVLYRQHFEKQKRLIIQKRHAELEKQKHIEKIKNNEQEENERFKQRVITTAPDLDGKEISITQIPSGLSGETILDSERISEYTDFLKSIIKLAEEAESIDDLLDEQVNSTHDALLEQDARIDANPLLADQVTKLCSLCKGGCCAAGGNHAYLHPATMRRLIEKQEVSGDELFDIYSGHLGEKSVVGSCINQTEKGCVLPREYRSDVCNRYLCNEVEQHLSWKESSDSVNTFDLIVQRKNSNWNRFEAVELNPVVQILLQNEEGELHSLALSDFLEDQHRSD